MFEKIITIFKKSRRGINAKKGNRNQSLLNDGNQYANSVQIHNHGTICPSGTSAHTKREYSDGSPPYQNLNENDCSNTSVSNGCSSCSDSGGGD